MADTRKLYKLLKIPTKFTLRVSLMYHTNTQKLFFPIQKHCTLYSAHTLKFKPKRLKNDNEGYFTHRRTMDKPKVNYRQTKANGNTGDTPQTCTKLKQMNE